MFPKFSRSGKKSKLTFSQFLPCMFDNSLGC